MLLPSGGRRGERIDAYRCRVKELGRGIINQTVILTESLKKLVMTQMRVDRVLEFQSDTGEFRREVYFLVQRRLIKIKPRQGQVAGLIGPHPSHESRDGIRE